MHVLLVSREYPPAHGGGIMTYMCAVTRGLAGAGARVSVISEQVPSAEAEETVGENIRVYRIPAFHWVDGHAVGLPEEATRQLPESADLAGKCDPEAAWALRVAYKIREIHQSDPIDAIEAQEYEAPLYYFLQLRLVRPDFPQVPVVTHMHSPTHLTKLYDEDAPLTPQNAYRKTMERFCAAASEAVCCPSETLSRWTDQWLRAEPGYTRMVRLPLLGLEAMAGSGGAPPPTSRAQGPDFLHVGRVELRKGCETLARALVELVERMPEVRVHLVGGDCEHLPMGMSMLEWLRSRILIHGGQAAQDALVSVGRREPEQLWTTPPADCAMACLIPSVWDNSPYTCIEAMARGHLMIVSDHGGQAEFVEHGRSGLVFDHRDPSGLARRMQEVIRMPEARRIEMGTAARKRILQVCGTDKVIRDRLALYREAIERFEKRGGPVVPPCLPHPETPCDRPHPKAQGRRPRTEPGRVSVVVPCYNMGAYIGETLESVAASDRAPHEVVVIDDGSNDPATLQALQDWGSRTLPFNLRIHRQRNQGLAAARRTGADQTTGDYIVFLDADDCVTPPYLGIAADLLDRYPEAGAVSGWYRYFGAGAGCWTPLTVQFPLFLMQNCVGAGAMVRRAAYEEAGGAKPLMRYNFEDWELWIAIADKGWAILTIPQPLFRYRVREESMYREMNLVQFGLLRDRMMGLHEELFRRHALECIQMAECGVGVSVDFLGTVTGAEFQALRTEVWELRRTVQIIKSLPRHPVAGMRWLGGKLAARLRKRGASENE